MQLRRLAFLLTVASLPCPSLCGQTPPSANLQVVEQSWTFKDGAPEGVVGLAQTTDGFLWLGGPTGLFRFDGTRFEPFSSPLGTRLLSTNLCTLFAPSSGGLWIGYWFGGFSFLNKGTVANYTDTTGAVINFAQDRDGIVWAATLSGLWRFDHEHWQRIEVEGDAPDKPVIQVGFDAEGNLWALAGFFPAVDLIYLRRGAKRFKTVEKNLSVDGFLIDADGLAVTNPRSELRAPRSIGDSEDTLPGYPVTVKDAAAIMDRSHSVWVIGFSRRGNDAVRRLPASEQPYRTLTESLPSNSVLFRASATERGHLVDREGNVWFGEQRGVRRVFYSPLIRQDVPNQLGETAVAADDNGAVWVVTDQELQHVSHGKVDEVKKLNSSLPLFAFRAPDKTFWFSIEGGLWHLVGRRWNRVAPPPQIVDQAPFANAIAQDRQGGLWISFGHLGLYRFAHNIWSPYGGRGDLPKTGIVLDLFTDQLGRVWFGYMKNQVAVLEGDRVRVFSSGDGFRVGDVTAIYGRGSGIWFGGEFGLQQFDQGRFSSINAVNEDWLSGISGIVQTPGGDLWLNGHSGIFRIPPAEISEALRDSGHRVNGEHFGRREGLPGLASHVGVLPTAIEGTDGRLWFALNHGLVWLDPMTYAEKPVVLPPITIQSLAADDKRYPLVFPLSLPAHTSSVQINYSAVSLSNPDAIRFRYQLHETDQDWHELAAASSVTYHNLPPGSYHFTVTASDTNGQWSSEAANIEFGILPAFHQTTWFRALFVLACLMLLAGLYQLRLRRLRRQYNIRLEERVSERTRIARELHDTLLQSFQGLLLRFQAASNLLPTHPEEGKQKLDSAIDQAAQAITEGRDAVQGLRSSATVTHDLVDALSRLGQDLAEAAPNQESPVFHLEVAGEARDLDPILQDEVYRIAGEALRNAFRHAQAQRIEVGIDYDERQLRLRIRDDGRGIDSRDISSISHAGHWGLRGMQERARLIGAKLELWSNVQSGTEIELTIPASAAYAVSSPRRRTLFSRKSLQSES